ncbi:WhiB family transcriptional regulator [Streptomyces caniscabiei]|uniref:WhiB family transcriptional regulator n=1 Tax=Streptomyces caniscabiei TaxID=2746961 RepID=UPI0038D40085
MYKNIVWYKFFRKTACRRCPAREQCLSWALNTPERYGCSRDILWSPFTGSARVVQACSCHSPSYP